MRRSLDRIFDPELWASVRSLYEDVAAAGDGALCAALQRFDGVEASARDLRVSAAEMDAAGDALSPELRSALDQMVGEDRHLAEAERDVRVAPGCLVDAQTAGAAR